MNGLETVRLQEPEIAWAQCLRIWRETEDAVTRGENALMRYYVRGLVEFPPRARVAITVLVAA